MSKILVIGDSCTDVFVYGICNRICPEAPVPILNPIKTTTNGGMAANVSTNLSKMGAEIKILTNLNDIKKIRYVDEKTNSIMLRIDENDFTQRVNQKDLKQITYNSYKGFQFDGLIISDYCKGFLNKEDINFLIHNNHSVFLDTKKILGDWMYDVDFVKVNEKEFEMSKSKIDYEKIKDKLIVTKGSEGCQYLDEIYPVPEVESVKDYSGAGDTFFAGFVYDYLKSKDIKSAINYAQECATIVVQKHGVATI
jgi:bifunctional ADP-heptose synthase (sugar kinase/adenylyltransferase)